MGRKLQDLGLQMLMWSVDPRDWSAPGSTQIVERVLDDLHDGAVILLHDGGGHRSDTLAALPYVIAGIRSRGYRIVALP